MKVQKSFLHITAPASRRSAACDHAREVRVYGQEAAPLHKNTESIAHNAYTELKNYRPLANLLGEIC